MGHAEVVIETGMSEWDCSYNSYIGLFLADDDLDCVPDSCDSGSDSDFDSDNCVSYPRLEKFLKHVQCK